MPQPDWAKIQKADEKSPFHGRRDAEHGPQEFHGGAIEEHPDPHGKKPLPFLVTGSAGEAGLTLPDGITLDSTEDEILAAGLAAGFPDRFVVSHIPPVTDQRQTPMCNAHGQAYDQNQHDRPDLGRFVNFDQAKFFYAIGGGPNGSLVTAGLQYRIDHGYPEQDNTPQSGIHRLRSDDRIANTITAAKSALLNRNHGFLRLAPYYHSQMHPFKDGRLPAPDYVVFYHLMWFAGFNDDKGFRFQQSWGKDWGVNGHAFMPYHQTVNETSSLWITFDR